MHIRPIWIYKFFYETIIITFSCVLAVCLCVITLNEIAHKMQMNNSLLLSVGTTVYYRILDLIPLGEVKLFTILDHRNKNSQPRNNCTYVSYLIFNKDFKKRPWFLGQKIQVFSTNDTDQTGWLDVEEWKEHKTRHPEPGRRENGEYVEVSGTWKYFLNRTPIA